ATPEPGGQPRRGRRAPGRAPAPGARPRDAEEAHPRHARRPPPSPRRQAPPRRAEAPAQRDPRGIRSRRPMPTSGLKTGFGAPDLEAVRRAVAAAEAESGGEIVPYVVAASDPYPGAAWKGAALGALAGALAGWAIHRAGGFWGGALLFWML